MEQNEIVKMVVFFDIKFSMLLIGKGYFEREWVHSLSFESSLKKQIWIKPLQINYEIYELFIQSVISSEFIKLPNSILHGFQIYE